MSGWNLSGQNLSGAGLGRHRDTFLYWQVFDATLANANLSKANLTNAYLGFANLTNADLSDASVTGAAFIASSGLSQAQLASTASYQAKDLQGISLGSMDLTGWDFSGQNLAGASFEKVCCSFPEPIPTTLTGANFRGANLANANLTDALVTGANFGAADTRGAQGLDLTGALSHDTILPDGKIAGLDLAAEERLVVRNSPIAVSVQDHLKMTDGGVLELRFDAAPWNSLISFQSGIPVQLGGKLDLTFAQSADPAPQVGHTLHVFDWSGVSLSGAFTVSSLYDWDTSSLYSTGVVTLLAAGGVIAGDSNADGKVDLADFGTLKDHFGAPGAKAEGDANGDGRIDLNDFGLLKLNFGKSAAAVPEPSSAILAVLAALSFVGVRRCRRQTSALVAVLIFAALLVAPSARADIFRWDNHELIPGTEGITPGPGMQFLGWNSEDHNLRYADFSGGLDLNSSWFYSSRLDNARFTAANLTGARLEETTLTDADLSGTNLTGALLGYSGCCGGPSTLTNANLSGANLTGANLWLSTLTGANLSEALVTGANFDDTTSHGFTQAQLKSTASYQAKDLQGITLAENDLTGWDFSGQNLADARFEWFHRHQDPRPRGSNLTNANLSGANLTSANLSASPLTGATLSGAVVTRANLQGTGLSQAQLASTASFQAKDLQGIGLRDNDLTGWDFSGQNLTGASFGDYGWQRIFPGGSNLTNANLSGANLTGANVPFSTLTNANLSGAWVTGVDFTASSGLIQAQLASTASYQAKDLQGIRLGSINMIGWDFSGQNLSGASFVMGVSEGPPVPTTLTNAIFSGANLANANLSGALVTGANFDAADTRGAQGLDLTGAKSHNTILPDGKIAGLDLAAGEQLVVRNSPIAVSVQDHLKMTDGGVLELRFDAAPWNSLISFQSGIPVQLGGKLDLTFAQGADPAPQVGHTLHVFDWSGVSPAGAFTVSSLYDWDTSGLYATGVVTLLAAGGVIAGDSNADGKVDLADFGTLKDHFGAPGAKSDGDANGDGRIDLNDFGLLKANFGKTAPGNVAVPEPATWALAIMGGVWLAAGRVGRRRQSAGLMIAALLLAAPALAEAQILRWDNGQVIPGTEGITPGPGVQLDHRELEFASLNGQDLAGANFELSNLASAHLSQSILTGANFSGSLVTAADFSETTPRGFAHAQLASTASYQAKNLQGIRLVGNDLTGWDFRGQNLTGAVLGDKFLAGSALANANLSGANLTDADVSVSDLTNANLSGANLTRVGLWNSTLTDADLSGAIVAGLQVMQVTGFTQSQLASTASYQAKDLHGFSVHYMNLSGWDFHGQNLTGAWMAESGLNEINFSGANLTSAFLYANLTKADLSGANLTGANLGGSTLTNAKLNAAVVTGANLSGITQAQLASTASYQAKSLQGVGLYGTDLSGLDLSDQNLTSADLSYAALNNANLSGANLTAANLRSSNLTNSNLSGTNLAGADLNAASFTGAAVAGADFSGTQLSRDQLYSTASYQAHELQGIGLPFHDLRGWNLQGQNLTEANLAAANLMGADLVDVIGSHAKLSAADLTLADLRAAQELDLRGTDTRNAILPDGTIAGLELAAGERLVVRNQSTPIGIHNDVNLASTTCTLELQFDSEPWTSGIAFSPGIPVQLGGRLELAFAAGVDVDSQLGRTFKIFDWSGVAPQGHFDVGGPYLWDASRLYTSGEVTLVTPEPTALTLTLAGLSIVALATLRRRRAFREAATLAAGSRRRPSQQVSRKPREEDDVRCSSAAGSRETPARVVGGCCER